MQELILLPNLLDGQAPLEGSIPPIVHDIIPTLDGLIAENEKAGRHFLMKFTKEFRGIEIRVLSEHTKDLGELLTGEGKWGVVSDAGLPCIADPGARLVTLARKKGIAIRAIPGPSSIFLALMLSGLSAQAFTFHGYFPRDPQGRARTIRKLQKNHTHVCIEAPYRNDHLLQGLIDHLPEEARLCVAWNLTAPDQGVVVKRVLQWKKSSITLGKVPAIYVMQLN